MRFKRAAAVAAVTAVVLGLAGCSSGDEATPQSKEKPKSLTMLVTASPSADALRKLGTTYEGETGIEIKFVEVPYEQLATKMILAAQSKQSTFDMAMVDGFQVPQIVTGGALVKLDDYLEDDEEYDADDFPEGLKDYAKQDGDSYGIPLSTEPYLFWYRTDLYDKLSLKPPTTWDEAIANAQALTSAGDDGYMPVYDAAGAGHFYNAILASYGGRLLDPDTYEPLLDTDVARKAMETYLELADYAPSSATSASVFDAVNSFSQGKIGQMTLASGWWGTVNNPDDSPAAGNFATVPSPLNDEGDYDPVSSLYGWLAGVASVSKYQDAAWDFLSWALSAENAQVFVDAGAPAGRLSTIENPEFVKKLPYLPSVGEASDSGLPMQRVPEMSQIVAAISQIISSMASDQMTLDEGMEKAQNDVLNILVQSGRYQG